ncbi:MAG: 2-oxoacid:acceptor oxidoreductase family protein [Theionarchaea archaeon]|nr:2-oxoacid:acceptor oxidoreductase family protein [Theionarchaea archaeon]MBU7038760.1 2-oxoacid:acceptor oxidoreductase family protein [Theionarchaea archaeon]
MKKNEVFTYLVGGRAGEGVKKAGTVAMSIFTRMGRASFEMDDYPSLIRGGHNFSVVSTAADTITSHYMEADLMVLHDERSYLEHQSHVKPTGVVVYNSDEVGEGARGIGIPMKSEAKKYPPNPELRMGVGSVTVLAAAIGMPVNQAEEIIKKEYPRDREKNADYARAIYELIPSEVLGKFHLEKGTHQSSALTGNQAAALGAYSAGLDMYFAYPMTPSTSILHFLAAHMSDLQVVAIHPENEIAVANMAVGAAFAGAKTMVGSSGGGLALMEETYSLAGMVEAPVVFVLSSRSGPSTGVPTYTDQGDLEFAVNQGHGEFPRIVVAPGSVEEAYYKAAELLLLVWRFQTPGTLVLDRHLSESSHTVNIDPEKAVWADFISHDSGEYRRYEVTETGISPLLFPPSSELIKWNSYEHDEFGITSDKAEKIVAMHDKRKKKLSKLHEYLKTIKTVNVYNPGHPVIMTYGSTTMSVLEALRAGDIDATVVQPVYLRPFPVWEFTGYDRAVVVEQSSTGQFATLLKEKAQVDSLVIAKYDGRPFDPQNLALAIKEAV